MVLHCAGRDIEQLGDFRIALSGFNQCEHFISRALNTDLLSRMIACHFLTIDTQVIEKEYVRTSDPSTVYDFAKFPLAPASVACFTNSAAFTDHHPGHMHTQDASKSPPTALMTSVVALLLKQIQSRTASFQLPLASSSSAKIRLGMG